MELNPQKPYFQKQGRFSLLCGVHSLNNLLGRKEFHKDDLNRICYNLSNKIINPHKHIFGGDFDINILMIAMQTRNFQIQYYDMRKPINISEIQSIESGKVLGYLLNLQSKKSSIVKKLSKLLFLEGRHWTSIKKVGDHYWFMDSAKSEPELLKSKQELESKLKSMQGENNQICVVYQAQ